jgi:hypothetical protein
MKRHLFLSLCVCLVLSACERAPTAQKTRNVADFSARDLEGTWAWYGVENCWNNGNTISFTQDVEERFHIKVRYYQATVFDVPKAQVARTEWDSKPAMLVKYVLANRNYEEFYQPQDVDSMKVVRSLVDSQPQQLSSINQPERLLVRCKDDETRKAQ